jgi:hypothetical protein
MPSAGGMRMPKFMLSIISISLDLEVIYKEKIKGKGWRAIGSYDHF